MADKKLTILGVHGLGDHRASNWKETWENTIRDVFPVQEDVTLDFRFVTYDDIFEAIDISALDAVKAVWKLTKSGVGGLFRRERGVLSDVSDKIKWTAGYVVAWVEDEEFKQKSRKRVLDALREHRPDVILAHSLGSLITYDAFSHEDADEAAVSAILAQARYVTLGSQIANPFVVANLTNGRVQPLDVAFWHHLYNEHDDVFTAPIRLPGIDNFSQTDTPFDIDGMADHAAESYLGHRAAVANVWQPIGREVSNVRSLGFATAQTRSKPRARGAKAAAAPAAPRRKALLVGINDYPNPAQRLEGCINDVFTMSAVLQDCGFPPDTIRTCLDGRATTQGILSRLKWLLDDPKPGDELIFYYSGHGARVPEYGENFEPDHQIETLVPWDFDWEPQHYIADEQIYGLYSQLPYDCRLVMIFDCCHSGGIHRDGGLRPRGITPPDDIRHRELKWDRKTRMWVPRDFEPLNAKFAPQKDKALAADYFGKDGATERIGRATMLRKLSSTQYERLKKENDTLATGPYLPLIIEACGEEQFSYEYRHGATSHGAFTYCLAKILESERDITFEDLVGKTRERLAELRYDQVPNILGPTVIRQHKVPWLAP